MSKQRTNPGTWPFITGLIGIAVLVIAIILVTSGAFGSLTTAPQTSVTPGTTETLPVEPTSTLPEQMTQSAVATILEIKRQGNTEMAMTASALPQLTWTPGPTAISDDEHTKGQWLAFGFVVENAWGGPINGGNMSVYAGAYVDQMDQGTLEVVFVAPYLDSSRVLRYDTPGKHGSIHIVSADNNRLTLISTDNTTFFFDIPGLEFVPSLTEVVPTITPPPTDTPLVPSTVPAPTGYPVASVTAAP